MTNKTEGAAKRFEDQAYPLLSDNNRTYLIEIPTPAWIALQAHPRQRNTERQAGKSHWQDIEKRFNPLIAETLRQVTAAELDGELYKVNGHSRAYLWEQGKLPKPASVLTTVYRCYDRAELLQLYTAFDNQGAALSQYDIVYGAYRQQGLKLTSRRLSSGNIIDALNIALRGATRAKQNKRQYKEDIDIFKAVEIFHQPLALLDSVDPQNETFQSGVIAAALIGLSLSPEGLEFYQKLSIGAGSKQDGRLDPVEAILSLVEDLKKERSAWVNAQQSDLCARTLNAMLIFQAGPEQTQHYWIDKKDGIPALDLKSSVAKLRSKLSIEGDPFL